jgi:hypothetical protein
MREVKVSEESGVRLKPSDQNTRLSLFGANNMRQSGRQRQCESLSVKPPFEGNLEPNQS